MKWKFFKIKKESGFSNLVLMAMIASGLVLVSGVTMSQIQNAKQSSFDLIRKSTSLFAAEGAIRLVQKLSERYLNSTTTPTAAELQTYITNEVSAVEIGPYVIDELTSNMSASSIDLVPTGPFAGMNAKLTTVDFNVRVLSSTGKTSYEVSQKARVGTINLFQFSLFGAGNYYEFNPGRSQRIMGRAHFNGLLCAGGLGFPLSFDRITLSNRFVMADSSLCRYNFAYTPIVRIWDGTAFVDMNAGEDSGCTNCGGSGLDWVDFALSKWNGNITDVAHSVPKLKVPGVGDDLPVQQGRDDLGNLAPNIGNLKPLVDPVLATDNADLKKTKYAFKADIRIVNGVWYLKDPGDPNAWPGVPIWSDHPGSFQATDEEGIEGTQMVGQSDLSTAWSWGSLPTRFSYYEFNIGSSNLTEDPNGVISYGNLYRNALGLNPRWVPGHFVMAGFRLFCPGVQTCTNCPVSHQIKSWDNPITCSGGGTMPMSTGLLNATRSGFVNGHIRAGVGGNIFKAKQLPINFDVEQFQLALQDTAPGELGSYFGAGNYMNRPFNGIVYITATWPGSMDGIDGTGAPTAWPNQGLQADSNQPGVILYDGDDDIVTTTNDKYLQEALPFPLCSSSGGSGFAGNAYDPPPSGLGKFKVPDCASYVSGGIEARPNALRIINGRDLRTGALPDGLTIASNLPTYILGDYNVTSDVSSATATDWVPALVAGDFVGLMSNAWEDDRSRWLLTPTAKLAATTTHNTSILAGYVERAETGGTVGNAVGIDTFTRYLEDWRGFGHVSNGSMVIGFNSVYMHYHNTCCGDSTYHPPGVRAWRYDPHLNNYASQPPGTPVFYVYAIESWKNGGN